jgi:thiosulfate/3-mercaptopyruvate sulfurtransferase
MNPLPLLVTPRELLSRLDDPGLLLIDLGKEAIYQQAHLPGAIHLNYARLLGSSLPATGLLPEPRALATLLGDIGLAADRHVVAYDDEGGKRAARLLWLLEIVRHAQASLLDGGIHAWLAEELPSITTAVASTRTTYPLGKLNLQPMATLQDVRACLGKSDVVLWDSRSPEEFSGRRQSAQKAGHIPGAVNYEWTRAVDAARDRRLRDPVLIRAELGALGIEARKRIITYCQTHDRAGFTWFVGKWLGLDTCSYAGGWAEWGNDPSTPAGTA